MDSERNNSNYEKNMSIWQNYSKGDRIVMLQQTALRENLPPAAIEKDWWVTVVLEALFMTDAAPAMLFKGGTSLSKGWHLIERLSEDVDVAIAYYSLKYVDYQRHAPERIDFVPPVSQREDWSRDYDNMLLSFIYGEAPDFTTLLKRMEELRERFKKIHADN